MTDLVDLISKTYGLVGLLILAPFASTVYLWLYIVRTREAMLSQSMEFIRHMSQLNQLRIDDMTKSNSQLSSVQEKRVSDAQEVVNKLITTVSEQTAMNAETNLALERVGDFLSINRTKHLPSSRDKESK